MKERTTFQSEWRISGLGATQSDPSVLLEGVFAFPAKLPEMGHNIWRDDSIKASK
jgi:hypothetical protein